MTLENFIAIVPAILAVLVPIAANTSAFLSVFDLEKSSINEFCTDVRGKIKGLKKQSLLKMMNKARENVAIVDSWLLEIVEASDRTFRLEQKLFIFEAFQKFYFRMIMNFLIISAAASLIFVPCVFINSDLLNPIVKSPTTYWIAYIYIALIILFILLKGKKLQMLKEDLAEFGAELDVADSGIDLQA